MLQEEKTKYFSRKEGNNAKVGRGERYRRKNKMTLKREKTLQEEGENSTEERRNHNRGKELTL